MKSINSEDMRLKEELLFDTFGINFNDLQETDVQFRDGTTRYVEIGRSLGGTIYIYTPTMKMRNNIIPHSWSTQ